MVHSFPTGSASKVCRHVALFWDELVNLIVPPCTELSLSLGRRFWGKAEGLILKQEASVTSMMMRTKGPDILRSPQAGYIAVPMSVGG